MNRLVPFSKFSRLDSGKQKLLSNASAIVDEKGLPLGFFFGRDSFISLMTIINEQFESSAVDPKAAYNNFAGKIIDLIEEKLPVKAEFVADLRESIAKAQKSGWVPLSEIHRAIRI